jgi:hypothetical protein
MNEKEKLEESLTGGGTPLSSPFSLTCPLSLSPHPCPLLSSLPCLSPVSSHYPVLSLTHSEAKHKIGLLQDTISRLEKSNNSIAASYGEKLQAIRQQFQSTTQMLEQVSPLRLTEGPL